MIINKIKTILWDNKIKKISTVYIVPWLLSFWGIGNVFYWEIYKGYKACSFCKWHRGLYFALLVTLILLSKYRKNLFKLLVTLIITAETIVSFIQVFGWSCNPLMCRRVSLVEKINFSAAVLCLILVVITEIGIVIYHKKSSKKISK